MATVFVAVATTAVIFSQSVIYQSHTEPVVTPTLTVAATSALGSPVRYRSRFFYQSHTEPVKITPTPPVPTLVDSEHGTVTFPRVIIWGAITSPLIVGTPPPPPAPTYFNMVEGDTGLEFQKTIVYQTSAEAIFVNKSIAWYEPLSEPKRFRRGLHVSQQQEPSFLPTVPSLVVDEKFIQGPNYLSIFKRRVQYQRQALSPTLPPGPQVNLWFKSWPEPSRVKKLRGVQETAMPPTVPPVVVPTQVFEPWPEPRRLRTILREQENPLFLIVSTSVDENFIQAPDSQTAFVRKVQYQVVADSPPASPGPPPISIWFEPWSEPQRAKLSRLNGTEERSDLFTVPASIDENFVQSPDYLVTFKRSILYQSIARAPVYSVVAQLDYWFEPLSEPVRTLRGIRAWLQSPLTIGYLPPHFNVTLTMSAMETNKDTASFGISVYNQVHRAKVSIKEIKATKGAAASIVET